MVMVNSKLGSWLLVVLVFGVGCGRCRVCVRGLCVGFY